MQPTLPVITYTGLVPPLAGDIPAADPDAEAASDGMAFLDVLSLPFIDVVTTDVLPNLRPIAIDLLPSVVAPALAVLPTMAEVHIQQADTHEVDLLATSASPGSAGSVPVAPPPETSLQYPGNTEQAPTEPARHIVQSAPIRPGQPEILAQDSIDLPEKQPAAVDTVPVHAEVAGSPSSNRTYDDATRPPSLSHTPATVPRPAGTMTRLEKPADTPPHIDSTAISHAKADRSGVGEQKIAHDINNTADALVLPRAVKLESPNPISHLTVQETAFRLQTGLKASPTPIDETVGPANIHTPSVLAHKEAINAIVPLRTVLVSAPHDLSDAVEEKAKPEDTRTLRSAPDGVQDKTEPYSPAPRDSLGVEPVLRPSPLPSADFGEPAIAMPLARQESAVDAPTPSTPVQSAAVSAGAGLPFAHPSPVQQASLKIARFSAEKAGHIELTLTPETLGRLHFEMRPEGGALTITMSAERPETLDLMRRHLPELIAELKQAGVQAGSFSFGSWSQGQDSPTAQPAVKANATLNILPEIPARPAARPAARSGQTLDLRL